MIWMWVGFLTPVIIMLALDLGVFHREAHVVSTREALAWSAAWAVLSVLFALFVYFTYEGHWLEIGTAADPVDHTLSSGAIAAEKYLTGYVVEKSLSVDNLFVIAMAFALLGVPPIHQHRVLYWGILGALALRGVMITLGAKLIAEFHWVLYLFAAFLIATALHMLFAKAWYIDPHKNLIVRLVRRVLPVTARFHGSHFIVRAGGDAAHQGRIAGAPDEVLDRARPGALLLTPLALALIMVAISDVIFAIDSVPAIFAITGDPFLVFTSNVFAILGLHALYFALSGMVSRFHHLKTALALVLIVVGLELLFAEWLKQALGRHFNLYLLGLVLTILAAGVAASLGPERRPRKRT